MSPASSLCYAAASTVTCKSEAEADQSASGGRRSSASSPSSSVKAEVAGAAAASTTMVPAANDQNVRGAMVPPPPPLLKVAKDSHRIRKPAMPLPQVQYRPPIIIHTYSPKVIHTKPDDFISLVQKLTGSSDTRLRLKRANRSKKLMEKQLPSTSAANPNPGLNADHHHQSAVTCAGDVVNPATAPPQGPATVGPSRTGCGSPSSSEESTFLASEVVGSDPSSLKQSVVSPRGPLSNYEFENTDSIFSSLVEPPPAAFFSTSHVKSEPSGFPFCNDFNFLNCDFSSSSAPAGNSKAGAITGATKGSTSHRQAQNQHQHHHQHMPVDMLNNPYNIDINTPLMPTPGGGLGFYSNPELSPTTARWYSQQAANFMDSSSCLPHGGHLAPPGSSGGNYMQNNPTPILRQRELVRYAAASGYCPSPEAGSTMVSLENIQAFMFS